MLSWEDVSLRDPAAIAAEHRNRSVEPTRPIVPRPRRAVAYLRFSVLEDRETSIERQERDVRAMLDRMGAILAYPPFVDRSLSGATTERPAYQQMLAVIRDSQGDPETRIEILAAEDLCRASRDTLDTVALWKDMTTLGVEIHLSRRGRVDEMTAAFMGVYNSDVRKKLAALTSKGRALAAEGGKCVTAPSYGYRKVPGCNGERSIHGEEAAVVRRVFDMVARGYSRLAIVRILNGEGVRPRRSIAWRPDNIFSPRRKSGMIYNPIYWGRLVYGRKEQYRDAGSGRIRYRESSRPPIVVQNETLRIVSDEQRDRALAALLKYEERPPRRNAPARRERRNFLAPILRCPDCGGGFTKHSRTAVLVCTAHHHGGCPNNARPPIVPLTIALAEMAREAIDGPRLEAIVQGAVDRSAHAGRRTTTVRNRITAVMGRLEHQLSILSEERLKGVPESVVAPKREPLVAKHALYSSKLEALPPVRSPGIDAAAIANLRSALDTLRDPFMTSDLTHVGALLSVVEEVGFRRIDRNTFDITMRMKPFAALGYRPFGGEEFPTIELTARREFRMTREKDRQRDLACRLIEEGKGPTPQEWEICERVVRECGYPFDRVEQNVLKGIFLSLRHELNMSCLFEDGQDRIYDLKYAKIRRYVMRFLSEAFASTDPDLARKLGSRVPKTYQVGGRFLSRRARFARAAQNVRSVHLQSPVPRADAAAAGWRKSA